MLYAFRLCILLFIQLTCVFAEKLKAGHRNWFSIIDPFVPLEEILNCDLKWKDIPFLLAHLSFFLTYNQIVFKNLNDFCYF